MNHRHIATCIFAITASAIAGACSSPAPGDLEGFSDTSTAPIVGGSTASAYPEAVLVDLYQGGSLWGYCSGSVVAPSVVMTAGHCVDTFTSWNITAPFASAQKASASSGATYDWKSNADDTVNPNEHDIGLIFLDTAITLSSYPTLATSPLASGASIVNIGRIDNGKLSTTALYVGKSTPVTSGSASGFPYDYSAAEIIQSGDSGGPDEVPGSSPHFIAAVNSGAGGSSEVLARVDLLSSWIQGEIASHGGSGASSSSSSSSSSGASSSSSSSSSSGGSSSSSSSSSGSSSGGSCKGGGAMYTSPTLLGASACGALSGAQEDWFSFNANNGQAYDLELSASDDAQIELWKESSSGYAHVNNTTATSISHTASAAGTYVVVVFSPTDDGQTYTLSLSK